MKLFDMRTEDVAGVLCEISPCIDGIVQDSAVMAILSEGIELENKSRVDILMIMLKKLTAIVPLLLREHKRDVFGILAAVNQKPLETVESQPFRETLAEIREVLNDKELLGFFGLSK